MHHPHDVAVARAATEVAAQGDGDLVVGRAGGGLRKFLRGEKYPRETESALKGVLLAERTGEVGDPAGTTTVVHCLTTGAAEDVDDLVARALAAGGGQ